MSAKYIQLFSDELICNQNNDPLIANEIREYNEKLMRLYGETNNHNNNNMMENVDETKYE